MIFSRKTKINFREIFAKNTKTKIFVSTLFPGALTESNGKDLAAPYLVKLYRSDDRIPTTVCCAAQGSSLVSCQPALVYPAALSPTNRIRLPSGQILRLANRVPAGGRGHIGYHFVSDTDGVEAVFTFNPRTGK
jgi:hypothetical protein